MQKNRNSDLQFMILTALAAALALAGDLLIGYTMPGSFGKYGVVQDSWSQVEIWRPALSLFLASLAFPFYLPGLYVASKRIAETSPKSGKAFMITSFAASTGWLMVHAVFCIPQFVFIYLSDAGYPELAWKLTDTMLDIFLPSVAISSAAMFIAFLLLFEVIVRKRTIYSRWYVLMNPLVIVLVIMLLVDLLPNSIFLNCLSMCKMNLGMFLFFTAAVVKECKSLQVKGLEAVQ